MDRPPQSSDFKVIEAAWDLYREQTGAKIENK